MFRVRYYDQVYHPDHFKKSGWRGLVIVVLNWIRWKLETYIQKRVLNFLAKEGAFPKSQAHELLRAFKLDVKAEELQKEQTSPLHEQAAPVPETPETRAERYMEGAKKTLLGTMQKDDGGSPMRPARLDNLVGQYAFDSRSNRYAKGRRYQADPNGDFEPLEEKPNVLR